MDVPYAGEIKREQVAILEVGAPFRNTGEGKVVKEIALNIPAKIEPLGGYLAPDTMDTLVYRQRYRVWIRYRPGVTAFHQLRWRDKQMKIDGVIEHSRLWLELDASLAAVGKL